MFAYLDETYGGADNKLTGVAAYLFDTEGRDRFADFYRADVEPLLPVDARGRKVFHAAACFNRRKPYENLERDQRELILTRMAGAIRRSVMVGVIVGVTQDDYSEGIKARYLGLRINKAKVTDLAPFAGSPYSVCLIRCVSGITDWLNREGLPGDVHYVIEAGDKNESEAEAILNSLAQSRLAKRWRFRTYEFAMKGADVPWLCAADYFAWVWQKNDRLSAGQDGAIGDWQSAVLPLIEDKPHLASYLSDRSVNVQALVNFANGLLRHRSKA